MRERVRLWREDYPHFAADPAGMVSKLAPLKPLVGGSTLEAWEALAATGRVDELFESVMVRHYDICYERSTRRNYADATGGSSFELKGLDDDSLALAVDALVAHG